jgi:hypothetical protein
LVRTLVSVISGFAMKPESSRHSNTPPDMVPISTRSAASVRLFSRRWSISTVRPLIAVAIEKNAPSAPPEAAVHTGPKLGPSLCSQVPTIVSDAIHISTTITPVTPNANHR